MFKAGDIVMVTLSLFSNDHRTRSNPCPGWVGEVIEHCQAPSEHTCCAAHVCARTHVKFSGNRPHCLPNIALKKLDGDPDAVDEPTEESVDA